MDRWESGQPRFQVVCLAKEVLVLVAAFAERRLGAMGFETSLQLYSQVSTSWL